MCFGYSVMQSLRARTCQQNGWTEAAPRCIFKCLSVWLTFLNATIHRDGKNFSSCCALFSWLFCIAFVANNTQSPSWVDFQSSFFPNNFPLFYSIGFFPQRWKNSVVSSVSRSSSLASRLSHLVSRLLQSVPFTFLVLRAFVLHHLCNVLTLLKNRRIIWAWRLVAAMHFFCFIVVDIVGGGCGRSDTITVLMIVFRLLVSEQKKWNYKCSVYSACVCVWLSILEWISRRSSPELNWELIP